MKCRYGKLKKKVGRRVCWLKPKARAKRKATKRKTSRRARSSYDPVKYPHSPRMSDEEWEKFTKDFNDSTPETFWSENGKLRHNRDGGKVDPAWNGYRRRR